MGSFGCPEDGDGLPPDHFFVPKGAKILVVLIGLAFLASMVMHPMSWKTRALVRHSVFILLHTLDYITNLLLIVIVILVDCKWYLCALVPVHFIIGVFCCYTAYTSTDWRKWGCPAVCNHIFVLFVLGLMQGVQVKLACDDYKVERERVRGYARGNEVEARGSQRAGNRQARQNQAVGVHGAPPAMMPARFHCKSMDGILESTVFSFVAMHILLNQCETGEPEESSAPPGGPAPTQQTTTESLGRLGAMIYVSAVLGFVTTGLALMEIDHRTSVAAKRVLDRSSFTRVRHLVFRSSEVAFRLLTILAFFTTLDSLSVAWYVPVLVMALDYAFGVCLLMWLGGHEPVPNAAFLLGLPLLMVNVTQFVDAPGMGLQARRMSRVIVPVRLLQVAIVMVLTLSETVRASLKPGPDPFLGNFLVTHAEWVASWFLSGAVYMLFLVTYACCMKPGADLHSAVADGDAECLDHMLHSADLVLDVNRYGPDGRTPLHFAAFRGQVECMRLLVQDRANLHARTSNRMRNTALHLAAMNSTPDAVRFLCDACADDPALLNAVNTEGNTAVHMAAQRQSVEVLSELLSMRNINFRLKNNKGQTPAECAPSDKFGFDRNSAESAVAELFRQAEANAASCAQLAERTAQTSGSMAPLRTMPLLSVHGPSDGLPQWPALPAFPRLPGLLERGKVLRSNSEEGIELMPMQQSNSELQQCAVPLIPLGSEEEQKFLNGSKEPQRRFRARAFSDSSSSSSLSSPGGPKKQSTGISSFMLSAGLGAMSHAFLGTIKEEIEEVAEEEKRPSVRANIDDFEQMRDIGEGAFGKVVLVKHNETGETFAMKLMEKAKFKAQRITSKAISEQFILKTVRHPFIVSLYYAFEGSTFWALVMDYCPNGDLHKLLCDYGTPGLPGFEIARYCGEVLLAVEHLHSLNVIFRDLKLENVVIDEGCRARVTDFGLAKKLSSGADARTMCGSFGYAAPEVMLNKGSYTFAVDLYSFGVMFYMMLTGGEPAQKNPRNRSPPMRHVNLRKKIREVERDPPPWAQPSLGAIELLKNLTSEDPMVRTSAREVKKHRFFTQNLSRPVDDLLEDKGPFSLPGQRQ